MVDERELKVEDIYAASSELARREIWTDRLVSNDVACVARQAMVKAGFNPDAVPNLKLFMTVVSYYKAAEVDLSRYKQPEGCPEPKRG